MHRTELIQRLRLLDTACVCDAEKGLQAGLQVMDSGIRPIRSGLKLVGTNFKDPIYFSEGSVRLGPSQNSCVFGRIVPTILPFSL